MSIKRGWLLVLLLILVPTALSSQEPAADSATPEDVEPQAAEAEFIDPFGESPFEEAETTEPEIPFGEDPETSEVLPARRAVVTDEEIEASEGPVALRFQFNEPYRMNVNSSSRMGFDERPELRQIYQSGMAMEYRPITESQRAILPRWQMRVSAAEDEAREGQPVLATVSRFTGTFDSPAALTDSARTHQILKDAAFSYLITDRGAISDLRIHPPTNPLARSSIEDLIRLFASSHPVFPEEAIEPGATWSQEINYSVEDGSVVKTHEVQLQYTFDRWGRCGRSYCAVIEVEQDIKAAGRLLVDGTETRSATVGEGEGWFLFDFEEGRVVRSRWNTNAQGNTTASRRAGATVEELAHARFNLNVETRVELLDRESEGYELVEIEED